MSDFPTRLPIALCLLVGLLAGLVAAAPAGAQDVATRADELTYPPLPAFDAPEPRRVELDNGLVVLLLPDRELPLVQALALIETGTRLDPADKVGLGSIAGEVLRSGGTESMAADELDTFLENNAIQVETAVDTSYGLAQLSALAEDFPAAVEVLADVLRRPAFATEKIELAKTSRRAEVARQNDDPQGILFRELAEVVYGTDSPYAANPTYETLANITRDDLVTWHQRAVHPNRTILAVVGDIEPDAALELVREHLGDWPRGPESETAAPPYNREPRPGVFYAEKNDINQSNIGLAHLGIRRDNPDYFAIQVMNQVLDGGMSSRLFNEVRTRQGLAYAVGGSVGDQWDREGLTLFFTTTKAETTGAAIDALIAEARRMTSEPPSEQEVAKAKRSLLASFVFEFDTPEEVALDQLLYEYFGYPSDWLERYREGIEAVTVAEVREAAETYLRPDELSIVVVGPSEGLDTDFSEYGEVTALDLTIPQPAEQRAEVTEEGQSRAAALLDRAVEAMGGDDRLASLDALRLAGQVTQSTPAGDMQAETVTLLDFPARMRQDLTLPMGEMAMVVTPDAAFAVAPQGTMDLPGSQADAVRKEMLRGPVSLLLARGDDGFSATAAGTATVDDTPVELVEVDRSGTVTTLAIDPETGRVLRLSYQGQGPDGAPGPVERRFSDFRTVDGLTYPFRTEGTFDGEPVSSMVVQSLEVNPEVEEGAFSRPE